MWASGVIMAAWHEIIINNEIMKCGNMAAKYVINGINNGVMADQQYQ
jgi:hypothetical protein